MQKIPSTLRLSLSAQAHGQVSVRPYMGLLPELGFKISLSAVSSKLGASTIQRPTCSVGQKGGGCVLHARLHRSSALLLLSYSVDIAFPGHIVCACLGTVMSRATLWRC